MRAENINTRHAKIKDAQIQDLTADKITAGTIDAQVIDMVHMIADNIETGTLKIKDDMKIENGEGTVELDSESFTIYGEGKGGKWVPRIQMGRAESEDGDEKYLFVMYDKKSKPTLYMDDKGNAVFKGEVRGGKIISDTSIDVTTDVTVGRYLRIGCTNYDPETGKATYKEGNIQFGGGASIQGGNKGDNLNLSAAGMIEIDAVKIKLGASILEKRGKTIATQDYIDGRIEQLRDWCNKTFQRAESGGGTIIPGM